MSWQQEHVAARPEVGAGGLSAERVTFIRRTYAHLAGAVGAFLLLEIILFQTALPVVMVEFAFGGRFNWLMIIGGFALIGWVARSFAASAASRQAQYAGLGLYVVAEAVIFVPMIAIALVISESGTILLQAGILTALLFTALTAVVIISGKDFSFLRSALIIGGVVAMGLIVCGACFGFDLGLAFSGGMVLLASGAILYDTSKIMHHYPTDRYVGAALELFASVALLLWYILRILMRLRR